MTDSDLPQPKSSRVARLVSESVVLALFPVFGFSLAFAFEAGYMNQFAVPVWVVEIDASHVIVATAVLVTSFIFVVNILYILPVRPWQALLGLLLPAAVLLLFAAWVLAATEFSWGRHLAWPAVLLAGSLYLAWSWIRERIVKPARQRLPGESAWDSWVREAADVYTREYESLFERIFIRVGGQRAGLAIGFLFLAGVSVYSFGERRASRQRVFAYSATESCIAIRRYHDHIVCVTVDTAAHKVFPQFRLLSATANELPLTMVPLPSLKFLADTNGVKKVFAPNRRATPVDSLRPGPA